MNALVYETTMSTVLSFIIAALFSVWVWLLKRQIAGGHSVVNAAMSAIPAPHTPHVVRRPAQHRQAETAAHDIDSGRVPATAKVQPTHTRVGGIPTWTIESDTMADQTA